MYITSSVEASKRTSIINSIACSLATTQHRVLFFILGLLPEDMLLSLIPPFSLYDFPSLVTSLYLHVLADKNQALVEFDSGLSRLSLISDSEKSVSEASSILCSSLM